MYIEIIELEGEVHLIEYEQDSTICGQSNHLCKGKEIYRDLRDRIKREITVEDKKPFFSNQEVCLFCYEKFIKSK